MKMKLRYRLGLILIAACLVGVPGLVAADDAVIHRAESLPQTTPWDLAGLSKAPEFEWSDGKEVRSLYFRGEPYKGKVTRVFAYYATPGTLAGDPAKDRNLPAIVLVHGGGGVAFPEWAKLWAKRGYAAIAMDLGGCGPDKKPMADGGPAQWDNVKFGAIGEPVTDQWTYHAVAAVLRAHSLIRSFPEVDVNRTAVTGISWGGYLTCIVAGLDNRFKAAVPVYGCGFLHENSAWLKDLGKLSAENQAKWVRLWDPSQYVGSAAMPMLFVNGGKDFAYPPDSYAKTYALVQSPKNIRLVPDLPHGHIFDRPEAIEVFIEQCLNKGVPLARITALAVGEKQVTASVETKTKLIAAELHYTLDALPGYPKTRQWASRPATLAQNEITAELPPENASVWFLTVTDERKVLVSSTFMFPKPKQVPVKPEAGAGK
jgi:cephalosporin-C deacetylase-like acetyl esterase